MFLFALLFSFVSMKMVVGARLEELFLREIETSGRDAHYIFL